MRDVGATGRSGSWRLGVVAACWCVVGLVSVGTVRAAERVELSSGFVMVCARHEVMPDGHTRLVMAAGAGADGESYLEVPTAAVLSVEQVAEAPVAVVQGGGSNGAAAAGEAIRPLLAGAEQRHRVDRDLLASVVKAESAGNSRAVSRTGARGLMQLMPGTATELGVKDAFAPEQNIEGGSTYLDQLLTRYHDDLVLALAAYNAGPAAVDRFHGVPPFHETREYVARVIREFNRRKLALRASAMHAATTMTAPLDAKSVR